MAFGDLGHLPLHLCTEHLVPGLRTDAALVGFHAVLVHQLGFKDVEDLLRVHVAATPALSYIAVHLPRNPLEVDHRVHGIAIIHGVSFLIDQEQPIEQLEDIRRRLMDDHENDPAFESELLQQVHDVLRIPGTETTGRFIHKKNARLADQLQRYVQAFALSTADGFVQRVTHLQVLGLVKSELLQEFQNAFTDPVI